MSPEELRVHHQNLIDLSDELFPAVDEVASRGDRSLGEVIDSMQLLASRLFAEWLAEQGTGTLDDLVKDQEIDWVLMLRKAAINECSNRLSEEFKRATSRMDREVKRRRQMPNAPAGAED